MKKMYQHIIIVLALCFSLMAKGQQDPQFTQYMYNQSVINPAYATATEGVINFGGLYRSQWVGLEGAPQTGTFFVHTPINSFHIFISIWVCARTFAFD